MDYRVGAIVFAALIGVPLPGMAQDQPSPSADCSYVMCALRMNGGSVLAGQDGRKVGSFGFMSAPQLRPWAATSDSASHYLRIVEENYVSGGVLNLSGFVLTTLGLIAANGWEGSDKEWIGVGGAVAGLGFSIVGAGRQRRARDAMQSAIWWYNGGLVDTSDSSARRITPPVSIPQHRGRAGVVSIPQHRGRAGVAIGSVIGLAAGLAISSRHNSSETAEGIFETLLIGSTGGLLGWRIGLNLTR